jgi:hypothetical protein
VGVRNHARVGDGSLGLEQLSLRGWTARVSLRRRGTAQGGALGLRFLPRSPVLSALRVASRSVSVCEHGGDVEVHYGREAITVRAQAARKHW